MLVENLLCAKDVENCKRLLEVDIIFVAKKTVRFNLATELRDVKRENIAKLTLLPVTLM